MIVGFTGTEHGMNTRQQEEVRNFFRRYSHKSCPFPITEVHHGDCVGADEQFHNIAKELGIYIVVHPPSNKRLRAFCDADEVRRPYAYLTRNRHIVDACDRLIATPYELVEVVRSGTWATIRYARKIRKPHGIIYPFPIEK